jgi:hypothetical protein
MADAAVEVPVVVDEPTVEVKVDDKPKPETKAPPEKIVTADEGVESLKAQVEKARRDSAERLAYKDRQIAEAVKAAQDAEKRVISTQQDQIGTIIDKLTSDKDMARRDYRAAIEAGEFDKAAEAQERMVMVAARIVKAEEGKFQLEQEAKNPPRQIVAPQADDVVEKLARSTSKKSGEWIRNHPQVVQEDGSLTPKALSAHYSALDRGYAIDSDAYFDHIESEIGGGSRRAAETQPIRQDSREPMEGRDTNRAPASAPVSRDVAQSPGAQRPSSIRLEPQEVQTAIDTYAPLYPKESRDQLLQRYAKDKLQLIDEGKITRRAS